MKKQANRQQVESTPANRWFFGVLIGLGVAIALSAGLDNLLVGLPVGIGIAIVFGAGLYLQDKEKEERSKDS